MRYYRSLRSLGIFVLWPLASVFADIALHRSGPDRLPSQSFLVGLLVAVYFPVNYLRLALSRPAEAAEYFFLAADTIIFFAFVFGILNFFRHRKRFRQTASALLGTDIMINLVGIALTTLALTFPSETMTSVHEFGYLVLLLWWIDVAGFIISKAIDQPYLVGIMLVVFYVVAALGVLTNMNQAAT